MDTRTETHRALIRRIFEALADGDGHPFVEALADDVQWTLTGTTAWSRTYAGKPAVRDELLRPLFDQFAGTYRNRLLRLVADGDLVVAECRGAVTTKAGEPYDNAYCYVFRLDGGRITEIVEYMDTALVERVLRVPAAVG